MKRYSDDWEPIYIDTEQGEKQEKIAYAQKKNLYGLTKEKFLELAALQNFACAICNADSSEAPYRLAVDHNYETNEIRGLLCSSCNTALGFFDDNPIRLRKAVDYILLANTGVYIPETGSTDTV
jgi:hypothetical protein